MQREAEARQGVPGGVTGQDAENLAGQQQEDHRRELSERWADRELEGSRRPFEAEPQPAESIMDEIDHTHASTGPMGLAPEPQPVITGGMLDALKKPENMIRLAGMGLGLIGLLLLLAGLRAEAGQVSPPSPASPAPTAAATGTPLTQATPAVNGTATATASFVKVSGPCSLAARFTDRYSFAATNGALTLTQLSNGHVSRGTIAPAGDFTTSAEGQGYRGKITGTAVEGQHTYTAQGCNEVYSFTMQLSGPLLAGGTAPAANRPPEAGPIVARQVDTTTTYTVQNVRDPDGDTLRYRWTTTNPCGPPSGETTTTTFTWPHPHTSLPGSCPEEAFHPATITVTIDDGRFSIRREYVQGSRSGTGSVPLAGVGISTIAPSPTAVPTAIPTTAAPTATATVGGASGGGPNVPLAGLGLLLVLTGLGTVLLGPRLAGGPLVAQQKDAEEDPCARERARERAAAQARDAADERSRRIQDLQQNARSTSRDAQAKEQAAADAARGASSYQGSDGRTVYTNPQQRARIEAAQAEAAAARSAADAAQRAFDAAGGAGEIQAAGDEVFRAHREHRDAKASLDACLRLVSMATPAPAPTGGGAASTGGATTAGGGVAVAPGTQDGTQTRTRPCPPGSPPRNEVTTELTFDMHDIGNAQIVVEGTRHNTDDSHARGFLGHLESINENFDRAKIGRGLAEGEYVGAGLDALEFPDFLTYFGGMRERLDAGMNDLLERLRQHRRQGTYTVEFTTHTFKITCRKWEECVDGEWVARSQATLALIRSRNGTRGPEVISDENARRQWINGIFAALERSNASAQERADRFRQQCQ
ncbi:MAG TPA: hypothetical protein VFM93_03235 [Candidatus Limnocylindria bacterium]|nr:hypothetical protein [Candidatus Limnocylindria bacterium]